MLLKRLILHAKLSSTMKLLYKFKYLFVIISYNSIVEIIHKLIFQTFFLSQGLKQKNETLQKNFKDYGTLL